MDTNQIATLQAAAHLMAASYSMGDPLSLWSWVRHHGEPEPIELPTPQVHPYPYEDPDLDFGGAKNPVGLVMRSIVARRGSLGFLHGLDRDIFASELQAVTTDSIQWLLRLEAIRLARIEHERVQERARVDWAARSRARWAADMATLLTMEVVR